MRIVISAVPQPPEHLVTLEVTFDSIRLAWNSTGGSTAMAPARSYVVQYRRNGSADDYAELPTSNPEILVDGLSPRTAYEFRVLSVNDVGRSLSAASVVVTTADSGQSC